MDYLTSAALAGTAHGFFGRGGGVSAGMFASLNCGYGSGDDKALVRENRRRVASIFGASEVLTCYQLHSSRAVTVVGPMAPANFPEADALVTSTPGLVLGVLTADCAPVLLSDAQAGVIAAAHAGWKGALSGIVEATIAAMQAQGAAAGRITAAIGPCISQASYQVGPEFIQRFCDEDAANARFFTGRQFDLGAYVAQRLNLAGVVRVNRLECDTCAEEAQFFSYRRATLRGERGYGRQLSVITLTQ
ncbi:MAG: peptidoglycan editing factor PgeF [Alphaproteobacteria bacterium]|nr:peptidoglycan editing factor PgeF [Alphaproteobacteria bacterium]